MYHPSSSSSISSDAGQTLLCAVATTKQLLDSVGIVPSSSWSCPPTPPPRPAEEAGAPSAAEPSASASPIDTHISTDQVQLWHRPSFELLHALISELIRTTGFAASLFYPHELWLGNCSSSTISISTSTSSIMNNTTYSKSRAQRLRFLVKIIACVAFADPKENNTSLLVSLVPGRMLAGQDPHATHLFLHHLIHAACYSSPEDIARAEDLVAKYGVKYLYALGLRHRASLTRFQACFRGWRQRRKEAKEKEKRQEQEAKDKEKKKAQEQEQEDDTTTPNNNNIALLRLLLRKMPMRIVTRRQRTLQCASFSLSSPLLEVNTHAKEGQRPKRQQQQQQQRITVQRSRKANQDLSTKTASSTTSSSCNNEPDALQAELTRLRERALLAEKHKDSAQRANEARHHVERQAKLLAQEKAGLEEQLQRTLASRSRLTKTFQKLVASKRKIEARLKKEEKEKKKKEGESQPKEEADRSREQGKARQGQAEQPAVPAAQAQAAPGRGHTGASRGQGPQRQDRAVSVSDLPPLLRLDLQLQKRRHAVKLARLKEWETNLRAKEERLQRVAERLQRQRQQRSVSMGGGRGGLRRRKQQQQRQQRQQQQQQESQQSLLPSPYAAASAASAAAASMLLWSSKKEKEEEEGEEGEEEGSTFQYLRSTAAVPTEEIKCGRRGRNSSNSCLDGKAEDKKPVVVYDDESNFDVSSRQTVAAAGTLIPPPQPPSFLQPSMQSRVSTTVDKIREARACFEKSCDRTPRSSDNNFFSNIQPQQAPQPTPPPPLSSSASSSSSSRPAPRHGGTHKARLDWLDAFDGQFEKSLQTLMCLKE